MTEYVRIPIREDEHKRLVALQAEWTGQINSYLTRPSLSDIIKKLLDERKAIEMNAQTTTVTVKFVAQSGHAWEEEVAIDELDTVVEQQVEVHGDIQVAYTLDENGSVDKTLYRYA